MKFLFRGCIVCIVTMAASQIWAEDVATTPCESGMGPSSIALRDSGFDSPRAACGSDSLTIGVRGRALSDTPQIYDTLSASLFIEWHWLHSSGFELGIGLRGLDIFFREAAAFTVSSASVGPVSLHWAHPNAISLWNRPLTLTPTLRMDVPFSHSAGEGFSLSASPGVLGSLVLSNTLQLHGRVSALLAAVVPASGIDSRSALLSSVDGTWAVAGPIALTVGTEIQGGWYGLGWDHWQARGGVRVGFLGGTLELSGGAVILGADRTHAVAWFGFTQSSVLEQRAPANNRLRDWAR